MLRACSRDLCWRKFYSAQPELYQFSCQHQYTRSNEMGSPPGMKKLSLALSACSFYPLGLKKKQPEADSIATIVSTCCTHLWAQLPTRARLSSGFSGNSAIILPTRVSSPSSFSAYRLQSSSRDLSSSWWLGGSRKSNSTRFLTPRLISCSTTLERLLRFISGVVLSSSSFWQLQRVYNLKHLPGHTLPARPARWLAEAFEIGTAKRLSELVLGQQLFCFTRPQSTTKTTLSIVILVSAMFVARTTFRQPLGAGLNILRCWSTGRAEQIGSTTMGATLLPRERSLAVSVSAHDSISSCPVKKHRMSPSQWVMWIWSTVTIVASTQSASGAGAQKMSTANLLPGTRMTGALPKQVANFSASRVALLMTNLRSGRDLRMSLSRARTRSVCRDRSWASSMMSTEYAWRKGSCESSFISMPSVMYLTTVRSELHYSNRTEQPTYSPRLQPIYSATRAATLIAATRRGCVHPIMPSRPYPTSNRNCGSCVVLPEPVSPTKIITPLSLMKVSICSWQLYIGNCRLPFCTSLSSSSCTCFFSYQSLETYYPLSRRYFLRRALSAFAASSSSFLRCAYTSCSTYSLTNFIWSSSGIMEYFYSVARSGLALDFNSCYRSQAAPQAAQPFAPAYLAFSAFYTRSSFLPACTIGGRQCQSVSCLLPCAVCSASAMTFQSSLRSSCQVLLSCQSLNILRSSSSLRLNNAICWDYRLSKQFIRLSCLSCGISDLFSSAVSTRLCLPAPPAFLILSRYRALFTMASRSGSPLLLLAGTLTAVAFPTYQSTTCCLLSAGASTKVQSRGLFNYF